MTSQTGQQLQYTYCPMSNKGNQAMKFGQLIDYSMRNIFLEISYTKCVGETSPSFFYKKAKLNISLDQQSAML